MKWITNFIQHFQVSFRLSFLESYERERQYWVSQTSSSEDTFHVVFKNITLNGSLDNNSNQLMISNIKYRLNAACGDCHSFPCYALYTCSNSPVTCGSPIKLASYIIDLTPIPYDGCCRGGCIIPRDSSLCSDFDRGFSQFCFVFGIFHWLFNAVSLQLSLNKECQTWTFQISKAIFIFYKQQEAFKLGQCWK